MNIIMINPTISYTKKTIQSVLGLSFDLRYSLIELDCLQSCGVLCQLTAESVFPHFEGVFVDVSLKGKYAFGKDSLLLAQLPIILNEGEIQEEGNQLLLRLFVLFRLRRSIVESDAFDHFLTDLNLTQP